MQRLKEIVEKLKRKGYVEDIDECSTFVSIRLKKNGIGNETVANRICEKLAEEGYKAKISMQINAIFVEMIDILDDIDECFI